MWKPCGYIIHIGIHPISASYLIYNDNEVTWTGDSNDATIFSSIEEIKETFPEYNNETWKIRIVIMTDEPVTI